MKDLTGLYLPYCWVFKKKCIKKVPLFWSVLSALAFAIHNSGPPCMTNFNINNKYAAFYDLRKWLIPHCNIFLHFIKYYILQTDTPMELWSLQYPRIKHIRVVLLHRIFKCDRSCWISCFFVQRWHVIDRHIAEKDETRWDLIRLEERVYRH